MAPRGPLRVLDSVARHASGVFKDGKWREVGDRAAAVAMKEEKKGNNKEKKSHIDDDEEKWKSDDWGTVINAKVSILYILYYVFNVFFVSFYVTLYFILHVILCHFTSLFIILASLCVISVTFMSLYISYFNPF